MSPQSLKDFFVTENGEFSKRPIELLRLFGTFSDAILYSELFIPKFIEIADSIVMNYDPDQAAEFESVKALGLKSTQELEKDFNWIEVGYYLSPYADGGQEAEFKLAKAITLSWSGVFKVVYPKRNIIVSVLTPEETGSIVGVGFYEIRP